MVKKRWYDCDPTLSMAVSLLQNASKTDQMKTAKYLFQLIERDEHLQKDKISNPLVMSYIFPFKKRERLDQTAWRLLEVLKHLPSQLQTEMALNMINYIYLLETGMEDSLGDPESARMELSQTGTE